MVCPEDQILNAAEYDNDEEHHRALASAALLFLPIGVAFVVSDGVRSRCKR